MSCQIGCLEAVCPTRAASLLRGPVRQRTDTRTEVGDKLPTTEPSRPESLWTARPVLLPALPSGPQHGRHARRCGHRLAMLVDSLSNRTVLSPEPSMLRVAIGKPAPKVRQRTVVRPTQAYLRYVGQQILRRLVVLECIQRRRGSRRYPRYRRSSLVAQRPRNCPKFGLSRLTS